MHMIAHNVSPHLTVIVQSGPAYVLWISVRVQHFQYLSLHMIRHDISPHLAVTLQSGALERLPSTLRPLVRVQHAPLVAVATLAP